MRITATLFVLLLIPLVGCYQHEVDTFPEWCERISGADLERKYSPAWAVIFSVSFDAEAIRDDYAAFLDRAHIEKVQGRVPRMAWREATVLHLVNVSTVLAVHPQEVISTWRHGIEAAKTYTDKNPADRCLYGTMTSLFDSLHIHSMTLDDSGRQLMDEVTVISTEREARFGEEPL